MDPTGLAVRSIYEVEIRSASQTVNGSSIFICCITGGASRNSIKTDGANLSTFISEIIDITGIAGIVVCVAFDAFGNHGNAIDACVILQEKVSDALRAGQVYSRGALCAARDEVAAGQAC